MLRGKALDRGHLQPIHQEDKHLLRNAGQVLLPGLLLIEEVMVLRAISLLLLQRATVVDLLQIPKTASLFIQRTVSDNSMISLVGVCLDTIMSLNLGTGKVRVPLINSILLRGEGILKS